MRYLKKDAREEINDILVPCKLCSNESIIIGHGYCNEHLKEKLTEVILNEFKS